MTLTAETLLAYTVPFLLVITLIVVVHELGHFLTAKAFGVAVDRFSIGFGRAIASWHDRSGVEWRIGWIPLGGYVRFAGDENAASVPTRESLSQLKTDIAAREGAGAESRYLPFKPLWQRALIVLAGPAANFALSTFLFAIFLGVFGEPRTLPIVAAVVPGGAAQQAGFLAGDRILQADGRSLESFQDLQGYVQYRSGEPMRFIVERGGRRLELNATVRAVSEPSPFGGDQPVGRLGIEARGAQLVRYGPVEAVERGAARTWDIASTTVFYLGRMISGQVSPDQLHSVVGIAHASGDVTRQAVASARSSGTLWIVAVAYILLQLAALVSVSIGLINLLPIPTLDGGHLLFYAYELITRRPPGVGVQMAGFRAGLALLVGLMLFATWNDLHRLRVFQIFGNLFS